jgi:phasin family protein
MSQKPRTGPQGRPAAVTRTAPKTVAAKASPAKAAPVLVAKPVVVAEPVVVVKPAVTAEPVVAAAVSQAAPVSEPRAARPPTIVTAATDTKVPPAVLKPTKPTPTQGMTTMMKSTEDFVAFSQANLEAFVKSGQIWSAGVQELTKQMATTAKASFEESVSTFKAITTCKSVKEAMDLQSTFAKAALEKAMAESNKLTDASIKLTEQTLAPITARVTVAVETFGKAA